MELQMKKIILSISILLSFQAIYAGCTSCKVSKKQVVAPPTSSSFIQTVNKSGRVKGLALASCGMCNFGMLNEKDCSLAIKINENVYSVKGTNIDDHGNSHAKDGFCNAVRVADIKGTIKDGKFESENFVLTKN